MILKFNEFINEKMSDDDKLRKSIDKLIGEINKMIDVAIDSDGDPFGFVDTSSTWEEEYVYQPIKVDGKQNIVIISRGETQKKDSIEKIKKSNWDFDGLPELRAIKNGYKKALKKHGISLPSGVK